MTRITGAVRPANGDRDPENDSDKGKGGPTAPRTREHERFGVLPGRAAHTHTYTRARARAHTHTHTHARAHTHYGNPPGSGRAAPGGSSSAGCVMKDAEHSLSSRTPPPNHPTHGTMPQPLELRISQHARAAPGGPSSAGNGFAVPLETGPGRAGPSRAARARTHARPHARARDGLSSPGRAGLWRAESRLLGGGGAVPRTHGPGTGSPGPVCARDLRPNKLQAVL